MAATATKSVVLLPLQLSAFALSESCCNSKEYKIAPIVQPNYTFLRMEEHLLESDILDHIDLHLASPAAFNSRLTDLGSGRLRENRLGVYIHWAIPQFYRMGSSATGKASSDGQRERKRLQGFPTRSADPPKNGATPDFSAPDFRPVPNRWLVTRHLEKDMSTPKEFPTIESWVVQSDALRTINDRTLLGTTDLETEVSPFIDPSVLEPHNGRVIDGQAEVFVGKKVSISAWDTAVADSEPSVDLNVMTSSNPLLTDYQPHNSNIFSIVDNFYYKNSKGNDQYLTSAKADYHVIGWHSDQDDDPLTTGAALKTTTPRAKSVPVESTDPKIDPKLMADPPATPDPLDDPLSHASRLKALNMELKDKTQMSTEVMQTLDNWLALESQSRVLCHGTMYDVVYNRQKAPDKVLAEMCGSTLHSDQPIAMGTTPIDALLAYCRAHSGDSDDDVKTLSTDLNQLKDLLNQHEDDDVDGLQAAADEAYEQSFKKFEGGTKWFYKSQTDPNVEPLVANDDVITKLEQLNKIQAAIDSGTREASTAKWKLFAIWWTWVSSLEVKDDPNTWNQKLKDIASRLDQLGPLDEQPSKNTRLRDLTNQLNNLQAELVDANTKGAADRFYQRDDPTLMFAKAGRGWDADFTDTLYVRLDTQVVGNDGTPDSAAHWDGYAEFVADTSKKLPFELQAGVKALLFEFFQLRSSNKITIAPKDKILPWFHDEASRNETRGRDMWQNTQPWRPLFIEWEALYYHIPFDKWQFKEYGSQMNQGATVVHYGVDNVPKLNIKDIRRVSGRNYLQPQAKSSFSVLLGQIFENTNPKVLEKRYNLSGADQTTLLGIVEDLDIVTTQLTGLTSHLLTLQEGSHLKPLIQLANSSSIVIQSAADRIAEIWPKDDTANLMLRVDDQGSMTPYASSVELNIDYYPMKQVQHGQLQLTKLNIIDKFGQAIAVIDPTPPRRGVYNTITPIVSDALWVGTVDGLATGLPNVAVPQKDPKACPFIALPPAINQPARLNAVFVKKQKNFDGSYSWRRTSDWDDPIWGWIVVNYADSGIQFFLADGSFYREIRLGGKVGTSAGFKYLPFPSPVNLSDKIKKNDITQLDFLIDKFVTVDNDDSYLRSFFYMINQSFGDESLAHAPITYANFSSAIVGKPLALVNAGWSLELAGEANLNWSTTDVPPCPAPERTLLTSNGKQIPADSNSSFTFPLKIGDAARNYDGLVGYFHPSKDPLSATTSDLDLDTIYTFFTNNKIIPIVPATTPKDHRTPIGRDTYSRYTPYWASCGVKSDGPTLFDHDARLKVLGLILDPFLPVHAYSAILPNSSLQLPQWSVEKALKKMTAFWRAGPLLLATDVPSTLDPNLALAGDYAATLITVLPSSTASPPAPPGPVAPTGNTPIPTVAIPLAPPAGSASGGGGAYRWLQPYWAALDPAKPGGGKGTQFNAFPVAADAAAGADAADARLVPGPYTAIEGYVQIAKKPDGKNAAGPVAGEGVGGASTVTTGESKGNRA